MSTAASEPGHAVEPFSIGCVTSSSICSGSARGVGAGSVPAAVRIPGRHRTWRPQRVAHRNRAGAGQRQRRRPGNGLRTGSERPAIPMRWTESGRMTSFQVIPPHLDSRRPQLLGQQCLGALGHEVRGGAREHRDWHDDAPGIGCGEIGWDRMAFEGFGTGA